MKPQINLLHLKYFCDSVVHNSISEAAKVNYVTQSAVSQAISKLEISLGIQVVIHSRQKFQVTEDGKLVFEQARHIFKAVQEIQDKVNRSKETVQGSVKFVSTNSLGMSFIAPTYQKMKVDYPEVDISFQLGNLNFLRTALRQGDAEFAIVVYDDHFTQFSKRTLKKGKFNLYQKGDLPHAQVENTLLMDSLTGMHVEDLHDFFLQTNHPEFNARTELAGWEVVARFTEMNSGIGFFPDYIMDNGRYPALKTYLLDIPSFEYQICAIYNKGEKLTRAASTFLDQFSMDLA